MTYIPVLEVSETIMFLLHDNAHKSAFAADMLRVIQRKGGLTENQLDMVRNFRDARKEEK